MGEKAHPGRPEPCAAHLLPSPGNARQVSGAHTGAERDSHPRQAPWSPSHRAPLAPSPREQPR